MDWDTLKHVPLMQNKGTYGKCRFNSYEMQTTYYSVLIHAKPRECAMKNVFYSQNSLEIHKVFK